MQIEGRGCRYWGTAVQMQDSDHDRCQAKVVGSVSLESHAYARSLVQYQASIPSDLKADLGQAWENGRPFRYHEPFAIPPIAASLSGRHVSDSQSITAEATASRRPERARQQFRNLHSRHQKILS